MTKTSLKTEKHFLGDWDRHTNYLKNSRSLYAEIVEEERFRERRPDVRYPCYWYDRYPCLELLHYWYGHGVKNGWLNCSYTEYEAYVLGKSVTHERPSYYETWTSRYLRRQRERHGAYRIGRKYQKSADHLPKEKSDRQVWREYKGFDRDKRPRHWFSGSRCRRFFKRHSNRQLRRHEKLCLSEGRHDDLAREDVRLFHDPWKWD